MPLPVVSEDAGLAELTHSRLPSLAHSLATFPDSTLGPFLVPTRTGYFAFYARVSTGHSRDIYALTLDGGARTVGPVRHVLTVEDDMTLLVASGVSGRRGAILGYATELDRGEAVAVLGLDDLGTPTRPPVQVARTENHIRWVRILPTKGGASCLWAEQLEDGDADLIAVALDEMGRPLGVPAKIAAHLHAWDVVTAGDGFILASVRADDGKRGSLLEERAFGSDNQAFADARLVARVPGAVDDVGLVQGGAGWHMAWTGQSAGEPAVFIATGPALGAGPIATTVLPSPSRLLRLVMGGGAAAVAWDDSVRGKATGRVELASIKSDGAVDEKRQVELVTAAGTSFDMVGTAAGFALTTIGETCGADGVCATGPVFLRLGADLRPTQVERLSLGDEAVIHATAVSSLQCQDTECIALTSGSRDPRFVSAVDIPQRETPFSAPLHSAAGDSGPRLGTTHAVLEGRRYSDVSVIDLGETSLVVSMASLRPPPGTPGRRKSLELMSAITLRAVDQSGRPAEAETVVSTRALANGGVAFAAAPHPEDGALVAWTARDDGRTTLHLTRVGTSGALRKDVAFAPARVPATSFALAAYAEGWLVAWTDESKGAAEVFVARIDRKVQRLSRIEQLTHGGRDVSDLSLAVSGETALVAWSEDRDRARDGQADVFVAPVRAADAKRTGDDVRVLSTAAHSRSPQLLATSGGFAVVWLEDAPSGIAAANSLSQGIMLGLLDVTGRPLAAPRRLALAGDGAPSAFSAYADATRIRIVVARSMSQRESIDAITEPLDGGGARSASVLVPFGGESAQSLGLSLSGRLLAFAQVGRDGQGPSVQAGSVFWAPTISSTLPR